MTNQNVKNNWAKIREIHNRLLGQGFIFTKFYVKDMPFDGAHDVLEYVSPMYRVEVEWDSYGLERDQDLKVFVEHFPHGTLPKELR